MLEPVLYIVATPIGNLDDLSPRAVSVLSDVALIAAEDTRHSGKLLAHFSIKTPMISVHDHNERSRVETIIQRLASGESIALVSDAGTPLISDPGYTLVKAVKEAGYRVSPVPGCVAFVAALSASGLPSDRFSFEGFLPSKTGARKQQLESLVDEGQTLIFYESTHRIVDSLKDMALVFGDDRRVCIAREITKTFETIKTDTLAALIDWVMADHNQQKGEFVVLVQGAPKIDASEVSPDVERVMQILLEELPVKQASALGSKITGIKKNVLYKWSLAQGEG